MSDQDWTEDEKVDDVREAPSDEDAEKADAEDKED